MDKKIEKIINKCLALLEKGYGLDECISRFEGSRDEIREYFKTVKNIKGLEAIMPEKDFQENSLDHIISEANRREMVSLEKTEAAATLKRSRPGAKKRLLLRPAVIFLVFLVAAVFSFSGTLFASQETVPGQVLYPLKKSFEDFKLIVYPENKKGDLHFQFLSNRIDEANILLGSDGSTVGVLLDGLIVEIDMEYQICRQLNSFAKRDEGKVIDSINNIKNMHGRMHGKNGDSGISNGQKNDMGQMGNNGGNNQNMGR